MCRGDWVFGEGNLAGFTGYLLDTVLFAVRMMLDDSWSSCSDLYKP